MFLKHFHRAKDKKLIFSFFISINRGSTERDMRLKIFTSGFLAAGIVFSDACLSLRYAPRTHSVIFGSRGFPHCGVVGRCSLHTRNYFGSNQAG